MSRLKLRNLLNLTEQAPQPPGTDSLQAMTPPQSGINAGQPDQQLPPPTAPDTSPKPENPNEYDFTKDFRAFEDKKNKAEADAKKVLMDKMNEILLGKTIVANASRGYGQPKTDYTIKNVKKVSVEFWYKDYVIIVSDENDKKYFLTTGINIKIEQSETPETEPEVPSTGEEMPQTPENDQESPNGQNPQTPQSTQADQKPEQPVAPNQEAPEQAAAPTNAAPNTAPQEDPRLKKKKKLSPQPVAESDENEDNDGMNKPVSPEIVQQELGRIFYEFLGKKIDIRPYIIKSVTTGKNENGRYYSEYILEIPKQVFGTNSGFDVRDFALEFRNNERHYGGPGQEFSNGSVDVQPRGRFYIFRFSFNGGLDI